MTDIRWHIVMSKSRAEWDVYDNLLYRSIHVYYPFQMKSVRQGHWKQGMARAIYPGYLFAGLIPGQSVDDIERTPGVSYVLRNGINLVVIPQEQLNSIKRACSALYLASLPYRASTYTPIIGEVVTIPHGAFMGLPAIINRIDKSGTVGASIGNLEVTFHLSALRKSERGRRVAWSDDATLST